MKPFFFVLNIFAPLPPVKETIISKICSLNYSFCSLYYSFFTERCGLNASISSNLHNVSFMAALSRSRHNCSKGITKALGSYEWSAWPCRSSHQTSKSCFCMDEKFNIELTHQMTAACSTSKFLTSKLLSLSPCNRSRPSRAVPFR